MSHLIMQSKIFGIGLSRTGTKSLAVALNELGIPTVWYPQDAQTFAELAIGKYRLSILHRYDGMTDTPASPYYPQWDVEYPGSKFILTTRAMDAWLLSCAKHWGQSPVSAPPSVNSPLWQQYAHFINASVYGSVAFHAKRFQYVYECHVRNVRHYFRNRPGDLLEIDVTAGAGWRPLCDFLGLAQPDSPFPHENNFGSKKLR